VICCVLTRVLENCTDLPARYRGGKWGMIMGRSKLQFDLKRVEMTERLFISSQGSKAAYGVVAEFGRVNGWVFMTGF